MKRRKPQNLQASVKINITPPSVFFESKACIEVTDMVEEETGALYDFW